MDGGEGKKSPGLKEALIARLKLVFFSLSRDQLLTLFDSNDLGCVRPTHTYYVLLSPGVGEVLYTIGQRWGAFGLYGAQSESVYVQRKSRSLYRIEERGKRAKVLQKQGNVGRRYIYVRSWDRCEEQDSSVLEAYRVATNRFSRAVARWIFRLFLGISRLAKQATFTEDGCRAGSMFLACV